MENAGLTTTDTVVWIWHIFPATILLNPLIIFFDIIHIQSGLASFLRQNKKCSLIEYLVIIQAREFVLYCKQSSVYAGRYIIDSRRVKFEVDLRTV